MKKQILLFALAICSIGAFAQDKNENEKKDEGFVFTTVKENPITSIKNQNAKWVN